MGPTVSSPRCSGVAPDPASRPRIGCANRRSTRKVVHRVYGAGASPPAGPDTMPADPRTDSRTRFAGPIRGSPAPHGQRPPTRRRLPGHDPDRRGRDHAAHRGCRSGVSDLGNPEARAAHAGQASRGPGRDASGRQPGRDPTSRQPGRETTGCSPGRRLRALPDRRTDQLRRYGHRVRRTRSPAQSSSRPETGSYSRR